MSVQIKAGKNNILAHLMKYLGCYNQSFELKPSEAAVQRCSIKKLFLKISQYLKENTCAGAALLINLQARGLRLY